MAYDPRAMAAAWAAPSDRSTRAAGRDRMNQLLDIINDQEETGMTFEARSVVALRAVLALHERAGSGDRWLPYVCTECSRGIHRVPWPCGTVRAVDGARLDEEGR